MEKKSDRKTIPKGKVHGLKKVGDVIKILYPGLGTDIKDKK